MWLIPLFLPCHPFNQLYVNVWLSHIISEWNISIILYIITLAAGAVSGMVPAAHFNRNSFISDSFTKSANSLGVFPAIRVLF